MEQNKTNKEEEEERSEPEKTPEQNTVVGVTSGHDSAACGGTHGSAVSISAGIAGLQKKERLSGAQRRKILRAKKMAEGTWTDENPYKKALSQQDKVGKEPLPRPPRVTKDPKREKSEGKSRGGDERPRGDTKTSPQASKRPRQDNRPAATKSEVIQRRHRDLTLDQGQADPIVASEGRFYGTNRQNPLKVVDLMDDSEHGKRQAKMGFRRLSREKDEFSGPPERYVGKGAYMRNEASVRSNRSWDKLQLESGESRSPWKKTDNKEQWKYQDYKSADTVPPWKTRDASSNRRSSLDACGKEAPGPPRRKRDASFVRGAWHQKDDLWNPFESEESRLSWNKSGASYDEESESSSKNRCLDDRNENGRSWKERDASFDRGAWNEPVDFHDREERGRPWERQGSPERYVDKGNYIRNEASVGCNRSWDELQLESEESRSWKKTDNREQWEYQDYKSADTVPPWKTRDASSNRRSLPDACGKEAPGPPRRKTDASFDRGAWHQKDDLRNPFESEESRLSWYKSGASYDEESGSSSKSRGLYDGNENGRSWKGRDASFDRGAWNEPGDSHDREERGRPWKRQAMEEERAPPLARLDMEENRMPLWKKRPMEQEKLSPWKKKGIEEETMPPWKRQGLEEERLAPLRRQDMEEDTMPPWKRQGLEEERLAPLRIQDTEEDTMPLWKKRVMEREMVKERAMEEGRMPPLKRQYIEEDRMSSWKKRGMEDERLPPPRKQSMEEESMSPWKKQVMEEERLPPWKKRAMEEERMPSSKRQCMEDDEMPLWKKQSMEEMVIYQNRQLRGSLSSGIGDIEGSLPPGKTRIIEDIEERVPPWNREREQELEERVSKWKNQTTGETVPWWKRQDEERLKFSIPKGNRGDESLSRRQNEQVISPPIRPSRSLDVPPPNKQKGRALPKKQNRKALNKRLGDRNQEITKQKKSVEGKGRKKADSDSDEDPTPVVPVGIASMICDKGYPVVGLTKRQSKIIMDCLLKAMEELDNESPQFSTPKFMMSGILSIMCANEHSYAWLEKKVEALKLPWKGTDLTVRPFQVPIIIHIPGAEEPEDEVIQALQKANPYFRASKWELMKKDILKVRVDYTYLIDFITFEALKVIQFRPYYKATRVLVEMVHPAFKTTQGSKVAVDNQKKGGAELTEADIFLKEATQTNEKVKTNSDKHELTEVEILPKGLKEAVDNEKKGGAELTEADTFLKEATQTNEKVKTSSDSHELTEVEPSEVEILPEGSNEAADNEKKGGAELIEADIFLKEATQMNEKVKTNSDRHELTEVEILPEGLKEAVDDEKKGSAELTEADIFLKEATQTNEKVKTNNDRHELTEVEILPEGLKEAVDNEKKGGVELTEADIFLKEATQTNEKVKTNNDRHELTEVEILPECSKEAVDNEKKEGAEQSEADIFLKEATQTNEKVKTNNDRHELTEVEILPEGSKEAVDNEKKEGAELSEADIFLKEATQTNEKVKTNSDSHELTEVELSEAEILPEGSKEAVDNEKKGGVELTEADIFLKKATQTNEKVKTDSDRHELTEVELSEAEIPPREIEQGEK